MATPARIRLQLLGRFGASTVEPSPRLIQVAGRQRRALLAYLAMQANYSESRERLAALLWGDRFDKQARQNLRQCLASLRKEFEPIGSDLLKIEREIVSLDPSCVVVDAREFLSASQSNSVDDLERAIGLYAGPFLDGLDLDVEAFTDWLRGERARVASAATVVFERYAEREDTAGHGPQAVSAAERLVSLDPLRESGQRLLLRILARHRDRDAALAYAASLSRMLRKELDADLEPDTKALIEEIRRDEISPATSIRVPRAQVGQVTSASSGNILAQPRHNDMADGDSSHLPDEVNQVQARPWVWIPGSKAFGWSMVAATAVLIIVVVTVSREQSQMNQPGDAGAGPFVATNSVLLSGAEAFDGTWHGTISCDKTSFTKAPLKTTLALAVSQGTASFTRPVYDPETVTVAGYETGKGTVAVNGAISLASIWPYPTSRTFTGSYSGVLSGDSGELRGTQFFRYDGKTEERSCSIELKR